MKIWSGMYSRDLELRFSVKLGGEGFGAYVCTVSCTRTWVRVLVAVSHYLESSVWSRQSVQRSVQEVTKHHHEAGKLCVIQAPSDQHQLSCTHGAGQTAHHCLHHHQHSATLR